MHDDAAGRAGKSVRAAPVTVRSGPLPGVTGRSPTAHRLVTHLIPDTLAPTPLLVVGSTDRAERTPHHQPPALPEPGHITSRPRPRAGPDQPTTRAAGGVRVIEFRTEIRSRVTSVRRSLASARAAGDDYLADVLAGELESLSRIAAEHHIPVDEDEPAA
jgi:hypothetical protein